MHLTVGDKITPLRKVKLHPGFYAFSTYYCLTVYPEWVTDCEYRNISCEENAIVLDNKYKYKNRFSLLQSPLWVRVCWSRSSTATRWPRSGWYILRRRTDGFFRTSITDVDLKALLVELCRTGLEDQVPNDVSAARVSFRLNRSAPVRQPLLVSPNRSGSGGTSLCRSVSSFVQQKILSNHTLVQLLSIPSSLETSWETLQTTDLSTTTCRETANSRSSVPLFQKTKTPIRSELRVTHNHERDSYLCVPSCHTTPR